MRFINWFFSLLYGRAKMRQRSLARGTQYLRLVLQEKGFAQANEFPENVLTILVQECYRRAAEQEPDNVARYGEYYRQMADIAAAVISVSEGDASADPRVKSILVFNKLFES